MATPDGHVNDAAELRRLIGYDDLPSMLTPSQVAVHVAKGRRWVQDNIDLFPGTRRDANGYYLIPKTAVLRYLQTRTQKVEP